MSTDVSISEAAYHRRARSAALSDPRPADWPLDGPIDLAVHDLPHASARTEWWYVNSHLDVGSERSLSMFASFFRIINHHAPRSGEPAHAHSVVWALTDPSAGRYWTRSWLDRSAPATALSQMDRGEGSRDSYMRRAFREVCEKGKLPAPDRMFDKEVSVSTARLRLDYGGQVFTKLPDGSYLLAMDDRDTRTQCVLQFEPLKPAVRHGENGVVRSVHGEDMFYYFIPRCRVRGDLVVDGEHLDVRHGTGWYDHEFGGHDFPLQNSDIPRSTGGERGPRLAWNWVGLQLDDGSELTAYGVFDLETESTLGAVAIEITPTGERVSHHSFRFEGTGAWRSTRTFISYPTFWILEIPRIRLRLEIRPVPANQEFCTLIARPAFWEGHVEVKGSRAGRVVRGHGYIERSGFGVPETLDDFLREVSKATRESIENFLPREPNHEDIGAIFAGPRRDRYIRGVDPERVARALIRPVRDIVDRGGKAWRSYAALACCDLAGGDSGLFVKWLAGPELLHVGSLIVDDVEDRSAIRRGGPSCHEIHGDALAINAGTSCYFMGQKILESSKFLTPEERVTIYDLYFEAMAAGHAGQALDLIGFDDVMESVVESGDSSAIEERILAVHRLKTAVPASALARMGAVAGHGTPHQVEAMGDFFEALGLAFQIVDDVLNLRGFAGGLKRVCEDITHGKVTYPLVKAMGRVDGPTRRSLWTIVRSKPQDQASIRQVVGTMERCGAIDEAYEHARALVEAAWKRFDPVFEDSMCKVMFRAFGWYILERHY